MKQKLYTKQKAAKTLSFKKKMVQKVDDTTLMIQKFQSQIYNGELAIENDNTLDKLDFVEHLNIQKLKLVGCKNIIPVMMSKTILQLHIEDCNLKSTKEISMDQLQAIYFPKNQLKILNVNQFTQLQELDLSENEDIDISQLCLLISLTKLKISKKSDYKDLLLQSSNNSNPEQGKCDEFDNFIEKFEKVNQQPQDVYKKVKYDLLDSIFEQSSSIQQKPLKSTPLNLSLIQTLPNIKQLNSQQQQNIISKPMNNQTFETKEEITAQNTLDNYSSLLQNDIQITGQQDLSVLKSLVNLKELIVTGYQDTGININSLIYLTKLTKLNLAGNNLSDISIIKKLTNLKDLDVSNNAGIIISPIKYLIKLTKLNISKNQQTQIN
ncbi:leucine-rich_repeat domain-containing protein [Hexamita inflata]|uniref:Leucine-rich repeat domain-containing protein n=1 Tax=Hexamita inflata TaxID=28002 RepID=A0AA86NLP9_9EUKA|nr:leucine-rich repeat domain-containing protein [Hexamita inflata]